MLIFWSNVPIFGGLDTIEFLYLVYSSFYINNIVFEVRKRSFYFNLFYTQFQCTKVKYQFYPKSPKIQRFRSKNKLMSQR